jgi:uncharacterized protein (DUF302 family)
VDKSNEAETTVPEAQVIKVSYAVIGEIADRFQQSRSTSLSLSAVVYRLRAAIETADLWVLHEIDPQALLRRGGYVIGAACQILFFHPRFVARIMAADPAALLEAPLKIALLELPDRTVVVRWFDPKSAFARYGRPELETLGQELAAVCEEIVTEGVAH